MTIEAERCLYIRLGPAGEWAAECIRDGQLRLAYPEVSHEFCLDGRWTAVDSQIATEGKSRDGVARHRDQIRDFYEASAGVLWITFHSGCMHWCFAAAEVSLLPDGTRVRSAIDGWHRADIGNQPLTESRLSGSLLAVQAYRGTICAVDRSYVLHKINGTDPLLADVANRALRALTQALQPIVEQLHPRDLEVLVDLIFRNAGWNRVGVLAETETDIDLALESAATGERIAVEVKSDASIDDYRNYSARYAAMVGFDRFYFVTHSVIAELETESEEVRRTGVTFWGSRKLAQRAACNGLAQWLIDKAT